MDTATTGGETTVCTCSAEPGEGPSATRDLPDQCVDAGSTFTVSITADYAGAFAQVKENLCDGWTYVSSSLDPAQVSVSGNEVTFTLLGETSFTYTVMAPSDNDECCPISGTIKDLNMVTVSTGGDSEVCTCPEFVGEGIILYPGWNFISTLCVPLNNTVMSVFEGLDVDAVLYYDGCAEQWVIPDTIDPLKGYWVNVPTMQSLTITCGPHFAADVELCEGWNGIGVPLDATGDAETILSIESVDLDDKYDKLWAWNAEDQMFDLYGYNCDFFSTCPPVPGSLSTEHVSTENFTMMPGLGYWIHMTQGATYSQLGS